MATEPRLWVFFMFKGRIKNKVELPLKGIQNVYQMKKAAVAEGIAPLRPGQIETFLGNKYGDIIGGYLDEEEPIRHPYYYYIMRPRDGLYVEYTPKNESDVTDYGE